MKEFLKCSHCGHKWDTRDEFLRDPFVRLTSYLVNFKSLETGQFVFEHTLCKNMISLDVLHFSDLYDGPMFQEPRTGQEGCPGYCLYKDNLKACKEMCECVWVRNVMQIIRHYRTIFA